MKSLFQNKLKNTPVFYRFLIHKKQNKSILTILYNNSLNSNFSKHVHYKPISLIFCKNVK